MGHSRPPGGRGGGRTGGESAQHPAPWRFGIRSGRSTCSSTAPEVPAPSTRSPGSSTWGRLRRREPRSRGPGPRAAAAGHPAPRWAGRRAGGAGRGDRRPARRQSAVRRHRRPAYQPGSYQAREVTAPELAVLVDTTGFPTSRCSGSRTPMPRAALGQLLVDAATALCADERQSRDNYAWFRSNNDQIQEYRDGLTLGGQGFSSSSSPCRRCCRRRRGRTGTSSG